MRWGLNYGSGQRPFTSVPNVIEWTNADVVTREGQRPDVLLEGEQLKWEAQTFDIVVLWHVIEHVGCGEADALLKECWRVLKPQGELIIAVPDLRALAQRWLMGTIDDYLFAVNAYGAYQGEESDRHRWMYTHATLQKTLEQCGEWAAMEWRLDKQPPGSDICPDWWMLVVKAVKP